MFNGMKILNIILSIFIFIFAAVSAVCSYFLFEKRAQFLKGHEKMAKAIYETSKTLDSSSGTDYAKNLTTEVLAHEKYGDLDAKLPHLKEQGRNIITQRDALAKALSSIGNILSEANESSEKVDAENFKKIDQYDSSITAVSTQLSNVVSNRNKAYETLKKIAKDRGGVDVEALKKGKKSEVVFKSFDEFIATAIDNSNAYREALNELAKGAGSTGDVSDSDRDNSIAAAKKAITERLGQVNNLEKDLKGAKRAAETAKKVAERAKKDVEKANKKVAAANKRLSDFKKNIGVSENFVEWTAGSDDARARLFGKVTGVSDEYGYFVIDLGQKSVVFQKDTVSDNTVPISLNLTNGVELVIVRSSLGKADPKAWYGKDGAVINSVELAKKDEFIAASKIVKVGENESVVDLPAKSKGKIKVGDIVLYKNDAK